jgi:hypothetical protein
LLLASDEIVMALGTMPEASHGRCENFPISS